MSKMTPSQQCKKAGLKSLAEVVRLTGVSEQTLYNWHKHKPDLFSVVIAGCAFIQQSPDKPQHIDKKVAQSTK